jgi:hypothetical protein
MIPSRAAKRRHKRQVLLERAGPNPVCQICGQPFTPDNPATLDHIVEQRYGGKDAMANLQLAHRACNDHRSNKPGVLWRMWRGRMVDLVLRNGKGRRVLIIDGELAPSEFVEDEHRQWYVARYA